MHHKQHLPAATAEVTAGPAFGRRHTSVTAGPAGTDRTEVHHLIARMTPPGRRRARRVIRMRPRATPPTCRERPPSVLETVGLRLPGGGGGGGRAPRLRDRRLYLEIFDTATEPQMAVLPVVALLEVRHVSMAVRRVR